MVGLHRVSRLPIFLPSIPVIVVTLHNVGRLPELTTKVSADPARGAIMAGRLRGDLPDIFSSAVDVNPAILHENGSR
jgi:hypothetical protein